MAFDVAQFLPIVSNCPANYEVYLEFSVEGVILGRGYEKIPVYAGA